MFAKIYQPTPSAMQSGDAVSKHWVLDYMPQGGRHIDPLTGTMRSSDTLAQISLKFDSLEDALAYARGNDIPHRVIKPRKVTRVHRSYSENFAYDRKHPWTH